MDARGRERRPCTPRLLVAARGREGGPALEGDDDRDHVGGGRRRQDGVRGGDGGAHEPVLPPLGWWGRRRPASREGGAWGLAYDEEKAT